MMMTSNCSKFVRYCANRFRNQPFKQIQLTAYFKTPHRHFSSNNGALIDVRSDTLTIPTTSMREEMRVCPVGDNVWGEDPLTTELENKMSKLLGFERGLFVTSGSMGNLISCLAHCSEFGTEAIVGNESHIHIYEQGGIATIARIHPRIVPNEANGEILPENIIKNIRENTSCGHFPTTKLICLENTHNRCNGSALNPEYIQNIVNIKNNENLKLHIDGARYFNAWTYVKNNISQNITPSGYINGIDSITVCLSKGLSAPVGSVICGNEEFIDKCHRLRKALGGGMRQTGVLSVCGLIAMEEIIPLLQKDHDKARYIYDNIKQYNSIDGFNIYEPMTNMVFINITNDFPMNHDQFFDFMLQNNIQMGSPNHNRFRLCMYHQISENMVEKIVNSLHQLFQQNLKN